MSIWDGLPPHKKVEKFGRTPDIDAADSNEDVWDGTGVYTFLSEATALTMSSSSANDTAAGTGAQNVVWTTLDANYYEHETTLTTNGQSAAATTITALRAYRGWSGTPGTNETNVGDIWLGNGTITAGVPANRYAGILANLGQTLMAVYTIPVKIADGRNISSAIIRRWYATTSGAASGARATVALQTRESGGSWRTRSVGGVTEGADLERVVRIEVPTKTDVRVRILNNGVNNTAIEAGFDIALLTKPA